MRPKLRRQALMVLLHHDETTSEEAVALTTLSEVRDNGCRMRKGARLKISGFRDRTNARNRPEGLTVNQNREQPTENTDGTVRGRDFGPGVQRGGRGQRGPRRGGDRHVNRSGRA